MIYLIANREEDFCKIGFSLSPDARLLQLQTGNPYPLELVAVIEGTIIEEKELHKKFADFKLEGEWFTFSPEIKKHFNCIDDRNFKTFTKYLHLLYKLKRAFDLKLIIYLAENMNNKNQILLDSDQRKSIISTIGGTTQYISTALTNLEKNSLIFKGKNGQILISPYLFWKGDLHLRNKKIKELNNKGITM